MSGRWDEKDDKTGKTNKVKERSHVVTSGKKGKRKFKKAVKALGKKYGQDAVLTQTKKLVQYRQPERVDSVKKQVKMLNDLPQER